MQIAADGAFAALARAASEPVESLLPPRQVYSKAARASTLTIRPIRSFGIARLEGIEGELSKVAISSLVRHTVSLCEMAVKIIGGFPHRNGVVNGGRLF